MRTPSDAPPYQAVDELIRSAGHVITLHAALEVGILDALDRQPGQPGETLAARLELDRRTSPTLLRALQAIEAVPSTLGVCQELRGPIKPQEVFDLRVDAVYVLEPQSMDDALEAALDTGEVYAFAFNYRGDFQSEQGVLVKNDKGYFALVGQPTVPVWSEFDAPPPPVFEAEEEDDSDDLDFEMF